MADAASRERRRFMVFSRACSKGNLGAQPNGIGGNVGRRRVDVIDLDIVVIQRKADALGGIPVQADSPDILLAACDAATGRGQKGLIIQIGAAPARLKLEGAETAGASQRLAGAKLAEAGGG